MIGLHIFHYLYATLADNWNTRQNISISLRQEAGSLKAESLTLLEFRNESQ